MVDITPEIHPIEPGEVLRADNVVMGQRLAIPQPYEGRKIPM